MVTNVTNEIKIYWQSNFNRMFFFSFTLSISNGLFV